MIAENLRLLKEDIVRICTENGRNPAEITLIAVSKTFGIREINTAFEAGQFHFGENKVQELDSKVKELDNKIIWHLIGTLQRNKVKPAVQSAGYIHSVDSLQLASEIDKRAGSIGKVQRVLLQVNTSDEDTKSGFTDKQELIKTAGYCMKCSNISLEGLMTIGPLTNDEHFIRKSFRQLRNLKDELNLSGFNIKELSMGMTSDYAIAIEEGATMLRVGSAIFGVRDYLKPAAGR